MPSLYVYYVTSDGGDAPCHQNGVTTLCTCKPAIRRTAEIGDVVVGLVSRALLEHSNKKRVVRTRPCTRKATFCGSGA